MKTVKAVSPGNQLEEGRLVIEGFQRQCDALDDILRHAYTKDLRRIRIPFISFPSFIFGLGDTLRFVIAHNERHLLQAQRAALAVANRPYFTITVPIFRVSPISKSSDAYASATAPSVHHHHGVWKDPADFLPSGV